MKCRYVADNDADMSSCPENEKHLVRFRPGPKGRPPIAYWKKGTERETPHAKILCELGLCEPADDECSEALGLTPEELAVIQYKTRRIEAGIHPEDCALYDAGVIVGYDADGKFRPGPNWESYQEAQTKFAESPDGI